MSESLNIIDVWDNDIDAWCKLLDTIGISYVFDEPQPVEELLDWLPENTDEYNPLTHVTRFYFSTDNFNLLIISKPEEFLLLRDKGARNWTLNNKSFIWSLNTPEELKGLDVL